MGGRLLRYVGLPLLGASPFRSKVTCRCQAQHAGQDICLCSICSAKGADNRASGSTLLRRRMSPIWSNSCTGGMTMNDLFLKVDGVREEPEAMTWSINSALQRNKVYTSTGDNGGRAEFRNEWAKLMRKESEPYRQPAFSVSDDQHCAAIGRISDELSRRFGKYLSDGRLRFGTSQKAFNLYLKYLWAMGVAAMPPHCPIDRVVLERLGIDACWTKSDSRDEYMEWINEIRKRVQVAEWENEVWLRWRLSNSGF